MIITKHGLECDGQDGGGCETGYDAVTDTSPRELREQAKAEGWRVRIKHPATGKVADLCPWCVQAMQDAAREDAS